MAVSSPPILKILSDLDIDLMDVDNDVDYLRALMEATNALTITNASDKRIPILQEEIQRVRADRKAADPKFKQKVKKTTVSPKKIMGVKMLPPAKLDTKKLVPPSKDSSKISSQGGSDVLADILTSITSIRDILINQIKGKRDDAKKKRRSTENAKRKEKESGLELLKKGFGAVKSGAEKVIAPVKGLFGQVFDFLGKIIFGRIVFKLLEWFQDKNNQDKVKAIGKFLKKTWPVLLAAYLLFGNAFGRMAVKLGVMITKFSIRLVTKIIPALIKAIAKMKLGRLLKRIPGLSVGGLLPQMAEGGMIEGPQSGYPVSLDGGESTSFIGHGTEEVLQKGNDAFVIPIDTPATKKNPFLTEERTEEANKLGFPTSGGEKNANPSMEEIMEAARPSLIAFMEQHNALIDSDPEFYGEEKRIEMDRDGKMLNIGKVVANMSEVAFNDGEQMIINNESIEPEVKEALLKEINYIRMETLDNPNFKADYAFDINKNIPGTAANRLYLRAQADTTSPAAMAGLSARDRALQMNRMGRAGGGLVKMNRRGMSRGGLLKGYARGGSVKFSGSKPNRGVNPPVRKSSVMAYDEQVQMRGGEAVAGGGGSVDTYQKSGGNNDIPDFDAAAKRSIHKIKTLGISV